MYHFLPSWHDDNRTWHQPSTQFYRQKKGYQFDDIIQYLRMFRDAGEDINLLVTSYSPNLRYQLHHQDLYEVKYWNVFDSIQNLEGMPAKEISYTNLNWPDDVEFVYTPFLIIANSNNQRYAHIEFGDYGELIWIDYFQDNKLKQRLLFDDRGFTSSVLHYNEKGQPIRQEYMNYYGEWQIRVHLLEDNQVVEVNPNANNKFRKTIYTNLEELILEKIQDYVSLAVGEQDTILIASDSRHNKLLIPCFSDYKCVLSFFGERHPVTEDKTLVSDLNRVSMIITDSEKNFQNLSSITSKPVQKISPFDARFRLGTSQRMKEQIIYILLNHLSFSTIETVLDNMRLLMDECDDINLSLNTYETNDVKRKELESFVESYIENCEEDYFYLMTDEDRLVSEGENENDVVVSRVALNVLRNESELIKEIDKSRLIIDLSEEPDLFTQIAGISAGIPQINSSSSELVLHQNNGYILEDLAQLNEAVLYYTDGLKNWNAALVHAVKRMLNYTGGQIVEKIKEKL